ncbi:BlaR1 family beta-lactam sensor/signal transducer [[Clostridium] hylemonae]|uniref:BlaR1 family beta-lactam sensor/signal transducer n=1 Tax=[Clostridium] hylemonae TaxID=89153 RepID=UPI001FCAE3CC|nr:BlaR1 family beta-lactam sensor/signal transducer [[Clostridium] hylemonae]BDF05260.1 BlaR1 family beta-lactam sensor/signal transducer [[Clostridium] hylemonae]
MFPIIRFLICNLFIAILTGIIFAVRYGFKSQLSARRQYQLWFLLLGLLAVPFLPVQLPGSGRAAAWFTNLGSRSPHNLSPAAGSPGAAGQTGAAGWISDFSISVSRNAPSFTETLLFFIWLAGMAVMLLLLIRSYFRLRHIKRSSLPLQNRDILALYGRCLHETHIRRNIPVHSTAFLRSPVITGFLKPCIYLPLHLISDCDPADLRYMLLHELQHYRHKDAAVNYLMNIAAVLYWFNPFVWLALKEMRGDRETACDSAVLEMLETKDYEDYGHTLINFAEKISLIPFPFASGMGGNMKQLKKRILNISSYRPESAWRRMRGICIYCLTALLLLAVVPALSTDAAGEDIYKFDKKGEDISHPDLSSYFNGYDGTFVLYDTAADAWQIYNEEHAALRVPPDSTYKIYNALLGLETGIISPGQTQMGWDGKNYPFEEWNTDQDLNTAMRDSVNWYFQSLDRQAGPSAIKDYLRQIRYGNEDNSHGTDTYWLESSLKISAIEQVQLLKRLYDYDLPADKANINEVKNALFLRQNGEEKLYGKTGTGRVNGHDVNGWFVGWLERTDRTYFFAVNLKGSSGATGALASDTAQAILADIQ